MRTPALLLMGFLLGMGCSSSPKRIRHPVASPIHDAIGARADDFRACYELEQTPVGDGTDPKGTVFTAFVIGVDGAASQAKVTNSTLKQPKVEACVLQTLQSTHFPKQAKPMQVKFPFRFGTR